LPKLINDKERYEFTSELSQLEFNKTHFAADADKLGRIIVRLEENALAKVTELSIQCSKHDVKFNPVYAMLNALLKGGATAEAQLNQKLGKKVNLLESLGVAIPAITPPKESEPGLTKPFKALLNLKKPLEDVCRDFTAIARHYHKTTHFKPDYLKHYAGVGEMHNKTKPSKWCYGVAIELLHKYKVNLFDVLPPTKAAEFWGWLQKGTAKLPDAAKNFMEKFHVPTKFKAEIMEGLKKAYGVDGNS
jgi:hypothetical protein